MSFSKAKIKRFNDINICGSPVVSAVPNSVSTPSNNVISHPERREQIEKLFKDTVKINNTMSATKEPIDSKGKDKSSLKVKGLRLFRTPSLPHRLRFKHSSDVPSAGSTIQNSVTSTPIKEPIKRTPTLKGKEALHFEIKTKTELVERYSNQIESLKIQVEQLQKSEAHLQREQAEILQKNECLVSELIKENLDNKATVERLSMDNKKLLEESHMLQTELKTLTESHSSELIQLKNTNEEIKVKCRDLSIEYEQQLVENSDLRTKIQSLDNDISHLKETIHRLEEEGANAFEAIKDHTRKNAELLAEVAKLKEQIEVDSLSHAMQTKATITELELLKNEKNALKNDLANKSELIRSLQNEIADKNCDIDSYCETIKSLEKNKEAFALSQELFDTAQEKIQIAEVQAEQKVKELEQVLEQSIERERNYWRNELTKRQHQAENQMIKIELEKQDVMELLESTNEMLRERDEKIQKYEDQLRKGLDYYVQLTDTLQKQVVALKADVAKIITEKYNYQLTLNNTRSTVNILMERLKKSDSDVESLKTELENVKSSKTQLESECNQLQNTLAAMRNELQESRTCIQSFRESCVVVQHDEGAKETIPEDDVVAYEEDVPSTGTHSNENASKHIEMYMDLKKKYENRELYMTDLRKSLDEFATVLQLAQLELDNKDKCLLKLNEENDHLKIENISLKSKMNDAAKCIAEKDSSDDEQDSQLREECDKITSWLLSEESNSQVNEVLKDTIIGTPKSLPRTPKTASPKTTPKTPKSLKTNLFTGKENMIPGVEITKSPLKARNK